MTDRSPIEAEAERLAEIAVLQFGLPEKVCYCQAEEVIGTGRRCPRCEVMACCRHALRAAEARALKKASDLVMNHFGVPVEYRERLRDDIRRLADERESR